MAFATKRTWKKCTDEFALQKFEEIRAYAEELYPSYFEGCNVELFIDKSTSRLGRCMTTYARSYHSKPEAHRADCAGEIRFSRAVVILSSYILHNKNEVVRVLCHEMGHVVSPTDNHGNMWRTRANKIAKRFGTSCSRTGPSEVINAGMKMQGKERNAEKKYVVECPNCHATWRYQRMCSTVQYPSHYSCGRCKTPLKRIL